ncbi:ribonuclease T2 [Chthonobacter rhizosphaerae]|uniref:ribonuclease T2 n=1 Tax=Chthonobacter rhizosphaerae TaxID=2735553 RepID=UPI0031B57213
MGLAPAIGPARADDRPGDFDFYVLALSWSPSWCEAEGDADDPQCDGRRPFAFTVHGLWPQRERGWPEFCRADEGPGRATLDGVLDVMPSRGLARYQWRKHGACSGLDPAAYFDTLRRARETVTIPPAYRRLDRWASVRPGQVEADFLAANPGLPADAVAVTCDERRLREVRVCLTKDDLAFRSCPEVDRRGCRRATVAMPPVR